MSNENYSSLVRKRGRVKASLTHIVTFVNAFNPGEHTISELQVRDSQLPNIWDRFLQVQEEIDQLEFDNDVEELQQSEQDHFERTFYSIKSKIQEIVVSSNQQQPSNVNPDPLLSNQIPHSNLKTKLPSLEIPKFKGDYESWLPFSDFFQSSIHSNTELTNVQKFHYLRSSLEGQAADIINSIPLSNDGYIVAWEILEKRFKNKRILIQTLLKSLFDEPKIVQTSVCNLRNLHNKFIKTIRALNSLERPTEQWDDILVFLFTSKLDYTTLSSWEKETNSETPSFEDLGNFLTRYCNSLEAVEYKSFSNDETKSSPISFNRKTRAESNKCPLCSECHKLFQCAQFNSKPVSFRQELVKKFHLCFNCLRDAHSIAQCQSTSRCKICSKKHNTLLHVSNHESQPTTKSFCSSNVESKITNAQGEVVLPTAIVRIENAYGSEVRCRALLDSGSQVSFITEKMAQLLKLSKLKTCIPVTGINSVRTSIQFKSFARLKSCTNGFSATAEFLVVPNITSNLPVNHISSKNRQFPTDIALADPNFQLPGKIDLLIGGDLFWDILGQNKIRLASKLVLWETQLGWIVGGHCSKDLERTNKPLCHLTSLGEEQRLDKQLELMWKLDDCVAHNHRNQDDTCCEEIYNETTFRDNSGRYVVQIPFKRSPSLLGDSRKTAIRRFLTLERRLNLNPELKHQYSKFMREYCDLQHMELKKGTDHDEINVQYYIPHHAVIRETSSTTKLRVVFDASMKSDSGLSLNDISFIGPRVQDDLFDILIRFRMHRYVISADIEKMYRQILINPEMET